MWCGAYFINLLILHSLDGDNVYYHRRYRFESTPDLFISSDSWKLAMTKLIDMSIAGREQHEEIDNLYMNFCITLSHEMDIYLKYIDSPQQIRNKLKNCKP